MFLSMKNVTICYDDVDVVKDISLELDEGCVITIIGSNGAGKTTIMKAICGLKAIRTGKIIFMDRLITGEDVQNIAKMGIGHVPEGRRLFPKMTVWENLLMGAYLRNDRKEIDKDLQEIYSRFPILKERATQLAGALSGGEQQMVSVARALMGRPKVILMDEPSLGLSPAMVRQISSIIGDIKKAHTGIILVEQNCRMALTLAERGYVLELGRIVMEGLASELLKNPYIQKAYLGG